MDLTSIIVYAVVGAVLTALSHRTGLVDLGTSGGKPADSGPLPPPLLPLPHRPVLQLLEQKLEAAALKALHDHLDKLTNPTPAAPAAPASPSK